MCECQSYLLVKKLVEIGEGKLNSYQLGAGTDKLAGMTLGPMIMGIVTQSTNYPITFLCLTPAGLIDLNYFYFSLRKRGDPLIMFIASCNLAFQFLSVNGTFLM